MVIVVRLHIAIIPDAAQRRSGIHNPCASDEMLRVMDSGFAPSARPGMTIDGLREPHHVSPARRSRCGNGNSMTLSGAGSAASSSTLRMVADQSSSP